MGGQDVKEEEVYKKKDGFQRKWSRQKYQKKRKETRRTLREESEQCNFLCNIGLLGQACTETLAHPFYNISPFFLIFTLGQSPLLLFVSLSYKFIDLG